MSLLRSALNVRFLRVSQPIVTRMVPAAVRHDSQTAIGTPLTKSDESQPANRTGESSLVNPEAARDTQVHHNQPDYQAEVDQASSYVSPKFESNNI